MSSLERTTRLLVTMVAALSGLANSGCNRAGDGLRSVTGSVQYVGADIESGEVRFVPIRGTPGTITGAEIVNGRFLLPSDRGLHSGTYRVEVSGYRNRNRAPGPIDRTSAEADLIQYVPAKYNQSSHETVTVEKDKSPLVMDLSLAE